MPDSAFTGGDDANEDMSKIKKRRTGRAAKVAADLLMLQGKCKEAV